MFGFGPIKFFLAAIAALAAGAAMAQDRPLDRVSVRADVFFYGAHVPIMLGIVDGIYKKHGIDATFAAGRGSATTCLLYTSPSPRDS